MILINQKNLTSRHFYRFCFACFANAKDFAIHSIIILPLQDMILCDQDPLSGSFFLLQYRLLVVISEKNIVIGQISNSISKYQPRNNMSLETAKRWSVILTNIPPYKCFDFVCRSKYQKLD